MRDAANQLPLSATPGQIINWFAREYPLVKKTTMRAHIKGLTASDPNRLCYSVSRYEPIFIWRDGRLDVYDSDAGPEDDGDDGDEVDGQPISPAAAEFILASHLEEFLLGNWTAVDWGRPLSLWQGSDGTSGHQFQTSIGRLDLLCVDTSSNALVVVELKRGRSADRVIGQVARYVSWVRKHLAARGQSVEGIVVAHEHDDRLRYAAAAVPGLMILTCHVTFPLGPAPDVMKP